MDEPTVGIDPQSRRNILDSVVALKGQGMTVLYTTHYMEEAQELSDHIAIMDNGKMIASGTNAELVKIVGELDRISVTINAESARVLEAWKAVQGVSQVTAEDGTLTILADDSNRVLPHLFETAASNCVRITSVAIQEPNLEAVFLHLTGKALRDYKTEKNSVRRASLTPYVLRNLSPITFYELRIPNNRITDSFERKSSMKAIDIALKDMTRSFRSTFALVFMFGVPLLLTGMFYFMFGGAAKSDQGFSVPVTKVVVANLDQGGPAFDLAKTQFPGGSQAHSLGDMVLSTLQDKSFASLMQVSTAASAEAARAQVDSQKAGVAIIIPADFSQQFSDLNGQAPSSCIKIPPSRLARASSSRLYPSSWTACRAPKWPWMWSPNRPAAPTRP